VIAVEYRAVAVAGAAILRAIFEKGVETRHAGPCETGIATAPSEPPVSSART
jgi:hypothetical protein